MASEDSISTPKFHDRVVTALISPQKCPCHSALTWNIIFLKLIPKLCWIITVWWGATRINHLF